MTKSKKKQSNIDSNLIKELLDQADSQELFCRNAIKF